jgi:putative endonuclease
VALPPRNKSYTFRLIVMYFVYILRSLKTRHYYIGSTSDVERRLQQHNAGEQAATRYQGPFEVVYVESHPDQASARRRERFIKRQKSHMFIEALIRQSGLVSNL